MRGKELRVGRCMLTMARRVCDGMLYVVRHAMRAEQNVVVDVKWCEVPVSWCQYVRLLRSRSLAWKNS